MKFLMRFTLLLWLLSLLSLGALLAVARQRTSNDPPVVWAQCDGKPCVLGLLPGYTRWDEAVKVAAQFDRNTTPSPSATSLEFYADGLRVVVIANDALAANGRVRYVRSITVSGKLTMGDLVMRYGVPCGAQTVNDGRIQFHYPFVRGYSFSQERLRITGGVAVLLTAEEWSCQRSEKINPFLFPWRGFTSSDNYRVPIEY